MDGTTGAKRGGSDHRTGAPFAGWDPDFAARSPLFEPLRAVASGLTRGGWPAPQDLQRLFAAPQRPIRTGGGTPLRIVAQGMRPRRLEDRYEARIYLRGELQVRHANWHDLLNALVWLTFPRAKAALNSRHYHALQRQRVGSNRGPLQDALTLLDEGGVIVASCDSRLLELVQTFQWKGLFWRERALLAARMRFFLFGHALYEKALAPFSGITGRALLIAVRPDLIAAPLSAQIDVLDRMVAERLLEPRRVQSTRDLAPLPILGVPGWCPENESASYYDDTSCFRPGRSLKTG